MGGFQGWPRCPAEPLLAFQSPRGRAGSTAATSPVTTAGARRWPASVPSASPWWRRPTASAAPVRRAGCRGAAGGWRCFPRLLDVPPSPPDIDECLSAACEGLCVNTEGGFVCECGPGMQLSADRHSCQGARGRGSGGGQRGRAGPAEPQPLPGRYGRVPGHAVPAPLQEQRGQLPLLLPARLPPPREPALLRG